MTTHRNRTPIFRERAREMRQQPNDAESTVWNALRGRKIGGYKFRRQYPIGNYIADFYFAEAKLIIELDGKTHDGKEDYDAKRNDWMTSQGLHVMRVTNLELDEAFDGFLEVVWRICLERTGDVTRGPGPGPSP